MKGPSLNNDKHGIDKLTTDILRKYHEGKLTGQEMHRVEKMLLDDPFAAEALEGMAAMDSTESLGSLEAELNLQVADRVRKGKTRVIPLYQRPWNIAAALVLLFVASYLLYNNAGLLNPSSSKSDSPIALEKPTTPEKLKEDAEQKSERRVEKPDLIVQSDTVEGSGQQPRGQESDIGIDQDFQSRTQKEGETATVATNTLKQETDLAAVESNEVITIDEDIDLEVSDEIEKVQGIAETSVAAQDEIRKREAGEAVDQKPVDRALSSPVKKAGKLSVKKTASQFTDGTALQKTISGKVISADDGHPLPGVSLSIVGSNRGVHTDINGRYELTVNESDSILAYSFIGYETEEVSVRGQEKIDVELEPDKMALEEVVIVAYGDESEGEEFIPVISAQPEGGNSGYRRYLKDSLRYPNNALDNKIEGKVKVTFFVQSDGRLSDFKVKRSLGYGCDEEVIRLIKEGPGWQPAKKGETQVKQKVRVKVRFKLEK